jgi:hypothetical protein
VGTASLDKVNVLNGLLDVNTSMWEEYQKRNRPAKPENWKGDVQ